MSKGSIDISHLHQSSVYVELKLTSPYSDVE